MNTLLALAVAACQCANPGQYPSRAGYDDGFAQGLCSAAAEVCHDVPHCRVYRPIGDNYSQTYGDASKGYGDQPHCEQCDQSPSKSEQGNYSDSKLNDSIEAGSRTD